ncbi:PTS sugar transporter subunit IIA [uncultured Enterococcus sp.]|uniref:PTS sugar transporter subunit IIA n=1 Tax=uncultured Enterococcus sp. TaxID=167972 RepID=UPI0026081812|nr:fructose PTS transporter subunit IIA [uncultured Enterococcus sp.]
MNTIDREVISEELIFLDVDLNNREDVIKYIAEKAHEAGYVESKEVFVEKVMQREGEVSTAIGYSIAIPHGKSEDVNSPFIAFLRCKEAFIWDINNSEETASLIFLIGIPKEHAGKLHLKYISELSKRLLNEDFRSNLCSKSTVSEIFEHLSSIEINK